MIKCLKIEPGKVPEQIEIGNELQCLQEAVGGYIECIYPWADEVAIICNEEGKVQGLPFCRALYTDDGKTVYDVIAGTFLIVGLSEDDFADLSDEKVQKYEAMFHAPEMLVSTMTGLKVVKI